MWLHRKQHFHRYYETKERENARFFGNHLTEGDITSIQTAKLNDVIDFVRSRSPFYGEKLRTSGEVSLGDLTRLPFTTKEDLKARRADLFSIPLRQCDLYCETTGTTGEAAPSLRHTYDRIWINSNWVHGWQQIIGAEGGLIVGISGPSELHGMVDTFTDVFQSLGNCVAKIYPFSTKVNFVKALKVMRDLPVDVLCVTPTVALMLAKAAVANGFDLQRDFKLKQIFLTGELCSDAMCANVQSFWNARATNNPFASQEALGLSVGGVDGRLYTLPLSYVYELVDPVDRSPVGPYGRGELVVTMIERGARPLIRFQTGDLVELKAPSQSAPIPSASLTPLGRTRDVLRIGGRTLAAHDIENALLRHLRRVYNYQLIVRPEGNGARLCAEVELEPGVTLDPEVRANVMASFADELGTPIELGQVAQTDGAASMSAIAGWKAARIKDLTAAPDEERLVAERIGAGRRV